MAPPVVPNVITYSSLLSALSNSRDTAAPARASEVFALMVKADIPPDTMCWTILIGIWARSKAPGHEQKAQQIFEQMLEANDPSQRPMQSHLPHCWPCGPIVGIRRRANAWWRFLSTSLLIAFISIYCPILFAAVFAVFIPLDDHYLTSSSPSGVNLTPIFLSLLSIRYMTVLGVKPDTVGYSSLLSALGRSDDPHAPLRANEVFEQMLASGVRRHTMLDHFDQHLGPLLPSRQRTQCQNVFDRMLESRGAAPNAVTYVAMLKLWCVYDSLC